MQSVPCRSESGGAGAWQCVDLCGADPAGGRGEPGVMNTSRGHSCIAAGRRLLWWMTSQTSARSSVRVTSLSHLGVRPARKAALGRCRGGCSPSPHDARRKGKAVAPAARLSGHVHRSLGRPLRVTHWGKQGYRLLPPAQGLVALRSLVFRHCTTRVKAGAPPASFQAAVRGRRAQVSGRNAPETHRRRPESLDLAWSPPMAKRAAARGAWPRSR